MKLRYQKSTSYPSRGAKTFDLLKEEYTARADNARVRDGALVPGTDTLSGGFPSLPAGVAAAYYSQGNGSLCLLTSSAAYRIDEGASSYTAMSSSLSANPFFADMYINGYSTTVLFSGFTRVAFTGMAQDTATDEKRFYTGTVHCGRFFARDYLDKFKLWWAASHALDWTEGISGCGYAILPPEGGGVLRLFSFEDRLVAVRERGITVVRAYGDPENFKVDGSAGYMTADGIIADTCAPCGGRILFCTPSGIYAFDGGGISRLYSFAGGRLSSPSAAAACGDMYYVLCDDEYLGSGRLFAFDVSARSGWVADLAPRTLFAGEKGVYGVFGTSALRLAEGGQLVWCSRRLRPGGRGAYIKGIRVVCEGDVQTALDVRGASRTFEGSGSHAVNMPADELTVTVTASGRLSAVELTAEV